MKIRRILNQEMRNPLIAVCMLLFASLACGTDTNTSTTTPTATVESEISNTSTSNDGEAIVNQNANLREGPGTDFKIVGSAQAGQRVKVIGKNSAGDWYLLDDQVWIAAFLVDGELNPPAIPDGHDTQTLIETEVSKNVQNFIPIEIFGVFTGVKVYFGAGENKAYGFEILGGSDDCFSMPSGKGIKVRYPNGSEEWKDRDHIVTSGLYFYVEGDPAAKAIEWYEYSNCP